MRDDRPNTKDNGATPLGELRERDREDRKNKMNKVPHQTNDKQWKLFILVS